MPGTRFHRILAGLCGFLFLIVAVCLTPRTPADEGAAGRKLALLVGVKEYDHAQLNNLQFPENDVEEMAEVLRKQNFEVVLLTTRLGKQDPKKRPTAANVKAELAKLLSNVTKRDLALIGLAGHGIQPLGSDRAYFCPQDANPTIREGKSKEPSTVAFPDRLIGIDDLLATLDDSGVGQKLLLVDACRNDPNIRGRRGVDRVKVSALPSETGVLLSCSSGQFAFEHKSWGKGGHGAFFAAVIDGLNGRASQEGAVTWETLAPYVRRQVPVMVREMYGKDGGEQRPNVIGNISETPAVLASVAPLTPLKPDRPLTPEPPSGASVPVEPEPDNERQKEEAQRLNLPVETSNTLGMKLRLIPAGEFLMGSTHSDQADEKPQHRVQLAKAFYLGKYEVTQKEWKSVMETEPWKGQRSVKEGIDYPATYVSWDDAVDFCRKLSKKEGNQYRLPTEAEWEYACRGNTTTTYYFGDGDGDGRLEAYAWIDKNTYDAGEEHAHRVGLKRANPFGLHDVHGNVWEWCNDWYYEKYLATSPTEYLQGPATGSFRVHRGGSWFLGSAACRSASRDRNTPSYRDRSMGFRVVRSSKEYRAGGGKE